MRGLEGQVAVVTGAASGIGRAVSLRLRQEGSLVVMADIAEPDWLKGEEHGGAASFMRTDVTCRADVMGLLEHSLARHSKVDILVNSAGIALARNALDTKDEEWDRVMAINLKGVFLCAQSVIPYMHRQGGGVIVNVASELGIVGTKDCAAYCASKGAVVQLTRAMAIDHAAEGIRINCVCPGPVDTPLLDVFLEATGDRDQAAQMTARDTLLGRIGTPEEIASVITFLASDDASYMTGAVVVADGGITAR